MKFKVGDRVTDGISEAYITGFSTKFDQNGVHGYYQMDIRCKDHAFGWNGARMDIHVVDKTWSLFAASCNPDRSPITFADVKVTIDKKCEHTFLPSNTVPGKTQWCAKCDHRE